MMALRLAAKSAAPPGSMSARALPWVGSLTRRASSLPTAVTIKKGVWPKNANHGDVVAFLPNPFLSLTGRLAT